MTLSKYHTLKLKLHKDLMLGILHIFGISKNKILAGKFVIYLICKYVCKQVKLSFSMSDCIITLSF